MESIRIVELQNEDSILALYNPDDMAERGLTSSFMTEHINSGMGVPALMQFITNFTNEHLTAEMHNDYKDYIPISLSIMNLPNDRVLPVILLIKHESDFLVQYMQTHPNGLQPSDEDVEPYINEYINEFLHETENNTQTKTQTGAKYTPSKSEQSECIDQYLFRFNNINTAISACRFVPFEKCLESHLIKYDKKYYILFSCNSKDSDSLSGKVMQFLEFGYEENNIDPDFLKEHGAPIISPLEKITQSGLI